MSVLYDLAKRNVCNFWLLSLRKNGLKAGLRNAGSSLLRTEMGELEEGVKRTKKM